MSYYNELDFGKTLLGKTLLKVDVRRRHKEEDDEITFLLTDGSEYRLYHSPDCCESVEISEIHGDIKDLIGSPLLVAEMVTNKTKPPKKDRYGDEPDSYTWTFYKLSTIKGSVTIRWYGQSNGYYSEEVDFVQVSS